MKTHQRFFGTDGIRGRFGSDTISPAFFFRLGYAVGVALNQVSPTPTLLLGRDTRESGEALQSAFQLGLSQAGVNVDLLGVAPTPAVAYLTQSTNATAGAMITASHNPSSDNGIKFFDGSGTKLSDELELLIEEHLVSLSQPTFNPLEAVNVANTCPIDRYRSACQQQLPSLDSLSTLSVVVDCAHGAMHQVAAELFHSSGMTVHLLGVSPDGHNINQGCGATDLSLLQQTVVHHNADLGIAFDGDGDRLMLVDSCGDVVDGDQILCLLALHAHQQQQPLMGVVGTLMSNWGLEQAFETHGIPFYRSAVGDRYVVEALHEKCWLLGGESSGHIIDRRLSTTGDGLMTAIQVLHVMADTRQSLRELSGAMSKAPQVMINVPLNQAAFDIQQYPELQAEVAKLEDRLRGRGRILLRPSGTEPLVRVMVEGNDATEVTQAANYLAECVADAIKKPRCVDH